MSKLTVGPVLFHWAPEAWRDFYFRMADESAVDTVYVGEVVCAKRAVLFEPHMDAVLERLTAAGKNVVRSTMALVMDKNDMDLVSAIAEGPWTVEANDISCVGLLHRRDHIIGPFINVYNEDTLRYLAEAGASRVCLPSELPAAYLATLAGIGASDIEVQVFGRLPLAISARCYHARSRDVSRDGCRFVCGEDPDGMMVDSLDDEPMFAVNGPQTLSATYANLLGDLGEMKDMGIKAYRLWPQDCDMVAVAGIFRDVLDGRMASDEGDAQLATICCDVEFSNGFYHGAEGANLIAPTAARPKESSVATPQR
jgi:collagenase-like PrtC family protease